ncbi:MAG: hypothetical protein Kow0090_03860 [Myxococcota bacterium]
MDSGKSVTVYNSISGGKYASGAKRYEKSVLFATPIEIRWQITNEIGAGLGLESAYIMNVAKTPDNLDGYSFRQSQMITVPFICRIPLSKDGALDVIPRASIDAGLFGGNLRAVKAGTSVVLGALAWDYMSDAPRLDTNRMKRINVVRSGLFFGLDAGYLMLDSNDKAPYISAILLGYEIGLGWGR